MKRRLKDRRICIICEGYEEKEYFDSLIDLSVFSNKYDIVTINSKSITTIIARYQEKYQSNSYDLVLIFCDTDRYPSLVYNNIKKSINEFHDANVVDDIVIFGNPCTMQIILSHFNIIKLTSQSKKVNSRYIEKFVGIKNYDASYKQRHELFGKIKRDNYEKMKLNVSKLSKDDSVTSSTNILKFLEWFESNDDNWINEINYLL